MNTKELRLGNLIIHTGSVRVIAEIQSKSALYKDFGRGLMKEIGGGHGVLNVAPDEMAGIKITDEILIELGFDMRRHYNASGQVECRWSHGSPSFTIYEYGDVKGFYFGYSFDNIKHVHDLQNLYFAIKRSELDVYNLIK